MLNSIAVLASRVLFGAAVVGGVSPEAGAPRNGDVQGGAEQVEVALPTAGQSVRVGGDAQAKITTRGSGEATTFACSGVNEIDTPLPVGYPEPTPPGAIDLKNYPSVRRAVVEGEVRKNGDAGRDGFWPLFRHIQRREIAMTSPVEMEYAAEGTEPANADAPGADNASKGKAPRERWTMAFLYRKAEQGAAGDDEADARVKVIDAEPMLVISIGMKGDYSRKLISSGEKELEQWLAGQTRFERAGGTRALYYHGPSMRPWRKWAEVQIPVREVGVKKAE